ncbi:MAG: 23S rRNA (uridine(2552)-2'-O)-methyltransferase RlmE [Gammaproteobacteria bacterium]|nr:23S rRNA (uridine(2552)-2'-O)-methyltransferase RlmE [Gammaproteobacteria bacterium]
MAKNSSRRWLQEHFADTYVKQAQQAGYRSRAVFKILELQEKDRLFKPGMTVVDLGASPGGWAQVVVKLLGKKGKLIALDLLPMEPLNNVEFILGDFNDDAVLEQVMNTLGDTQPDWVISDMAPNISGIDSVDQPRSMALAELALDFALSVLKPSGGFLVKAFQGEGFEFFLTSVRKNFKEVFIRKPKASRDRSREVYILAKGKK